MNTKFYEKELKLHWPCKEHPTRTSDPLAEVKAAYARGELIEFKLSNGEWAMAGTPAWRPTKEYRVKPAPEWTPRFKVGQRVRIKPPTVIASHANRVDVVVQTISRTHHEGASCYLKDSGWYYESQLEPIPWTLPTPPEGYEHHRNDFTEEMLPPGWRPLCDGEPCEEGDQVWVGREWSDGIDTGFRMGPLHLPTRTRRPYPAAKTPAKKVVDLEASDMLAAQWLRFSPDENAKLILEVSPGGEIYHTQHSSRTLNQLRTEKCEWSADRITWNPCEKEVEA